MSEDCSDCNGSDSSKCTEHQPYFKRDLTIQYSVNHF